MAELLTSLVAILRINEYHKLTSGVEVNKLDSASTVKLLKGN